MSGYGTDQGFIDWLDAQGLELPDDAPAESTLRQVGSDYVDAAYGHALQCSKRAGGFEQERAWPRTGHRIGGELVPDDLIPPAWVQASYRAGYLHAVTPGWATNSTDPNRVTKREKVDTIEREFFAAGEAGGSLSTPGMVSDAIINGMVAPWLCSKARDVGALFRVI